MTQGSGMPRAVVGGRGRMPQGGGWPPPRMAEGRGRRQRAATRGRGLPLLPTAGLAFAAAGHVRGHLQASDAPRSAATAAESWEEIYVAGAVAFSAAVSAATSADHARFAVAGAQLSSPCSSRLACATPQAGGPPSPRAGTPPWSGRRRRRRRASKQARGSPLPRLESSYAAG